MLKLIDNLTKLTAGLVMVFLLATPATTLFGSFVLLQGTPPPATYTR